MKKIQQMDTVQNEIKEDQDKYKEFISKREKEINVMIATKLRAKMSTSMNKVKKLAMPAAFFT